MKTALVRIGVVVGATILLAAWTYGTVRLARRGMSDVSDYDIELLRQDIERIDSQFALSKIESNDVDRKLLDLEQEISQSRLLAPPPPPTRPTWEEISMKSDVEQLHKEIRDLESNLRLGTYRR